mgnify:CR=1 FL=1
MLGNGLRIVRLAAGIVLACAALLFILVFKNTALPRQGCYELFRYLAHEENEIRTFNFEWIETEHFVIKFVEEDRGYSDLVARTAENAFEPVTAFFSFQPRDKAVIVMYPDGETLASSFGWDKDERAMGVYWGGIIRVLSPREWIHEGDLEQTFTRDGPVVHEYTHLVVDQLTRGNYNRWFTEGVAQYVEKKVTGFTLEAPSPDGKVEVYNFATLERDFDQLDQGMAYWQSLQAVEYMVELGGEPGLLRVIEALGKGYTLPGAIEKGLQVEYDSFTKDLYARLRHAG